MILHQLRDDTIQRLLRVYGVSIHGSRWVQEAEEVMESLCKRLRLRLRLPLAFRHLTWATNVAHNAGE